MEDNVLLIELAEELQDQIWSPAASIPALETAFRERLCGAGPTLAEVLDELSDESLALAFQRNFEPDATFETLMHDRYGQYMLRWLRSWRTESSTAHDLIQDIYLHWWATRLGSYQSAQSFRAYLYQAVYHRWVDKVWRAKKPYSLDGVPEVVSLHPDPAEELLGREMEARIDAAIPRLPPRERAVMTALIAGHSVDAITTSLGVSKKAVFMAVHHARNRLEEWLDIPRRQSSPCSPEPIQESQSCPAP